MFSIISKLPYELFNGEFNIYAEFCKDFRDESDEFILLTQGNSVDKITDINLPCSRIELGQGFYWLMNNQGFDIRVYERPLMEREVRGYVTN